MRAKTDFWIELTLTEYSGNLFILVPASTSIIQRAWRI